MFAAFAIVVWILVADVEGDNCRSTALCFMEKASSIVHKEMWKRTAVIHDIENVGILQALRGVEIMVYELNYSTTVRTILTEIHTQLFPDINVLVAVEETRLVQKVFYEADGIDNKNNHSTDWTHHSKWFVFTTVTSNVKIDVIKLTNLQNVVLITRIAEACTCSFDIFTIASAFGAYKFRQLNEAKTGSFGMLPNTKYGYNGRTLRVSAIESDPFVIPVNFGEKDGVPFTGYNLDILRTIADHLNMTLKYVPPRDGIWGWIDDGMMGQLNRRELDLVASEMMIHVTRAKHIDYILPVLHVDELVLLYKMSPDKPIFLLARPLSAAVYLTYLVVTVAAISALVVLETIAIPPKANRKSVGSLCWGAIRIPLKQSGIMNDIRDSSRILLAFWWLLVMLMSSLYCGNLTASLASSSTLKKFDSLKEAVESDYTAGFIPGGIEEQILKNSTGENVRRFYEKIRQSNTTDPDVTSTHLNSHIQRVKAGNYLFLTYKLNIANKIHNDCNISMLPVNFIPHLAITFCVQRDSPFRDDINEVMHQLRSKGILDRMWKKWSNQTISSSCDRGSRSVTLLELTGGVIIVSSGIGAASIVLLFECLRMWFLRS